MNAAHLHIIINHLPVLGSLIGAFVLSYGLFTKSLHARLAGFYILIIASAGGLVTYFSGKEAEEIIEHTAAIHEAIEAHEDFAVFALAALVLSGVGAVAGVVFTRRRSSKGPGISVIVLILALVSALVAGYTGFLGGKIMHPEASGLPLPQSEKPAEGSNPETKKEHNHNHDH